MRRRCMQPEANISIEERAAWTRGAPLIVRSAIPLAVVRHQQQQQQRTASTLTWSIQFGLFLREKTRF